MPVFIVLVLKQAHGANSEVAGVGRSAAIQLQRVHVAMPGVVHGRGIAHPSSVSAKQPILLTSSICLRKSPWCRSVPSLRTEPPNRLNCICQQEFSTLRRASQERAVGAAINKKESAMAPDMQHLHGHLGPQGAISTHCCTFVCSKYPQRVVPKIKDGNETGTTQRL